MCQCLEMGLSWLGSGDLAAAEDAILEYTRHVIQVCPDCQRDYAAFVQGGLRALKKTRAASQSGSHSGDDPASGKSSPPANPRDEVALYLDSWRRRRKALLKAERELEELLPLSPPDRRHLVERANRRFKTPYLVEVLLRRVKESIFEDSGEALELAELAVVVAQNIPRDRYGDKPVAAAQARALGYLGNAQRVTLNLAKAASSLERAFDLACQDCPEDRALHAEILSLLASLRQDQGRSTEVLEILDRAIGIYKVAGNHHLVGRAMLKRSKALSFLGQLEASLAAAREARDLIDASQEPLLELIARERLIVILAKLGRGREAKLELEACRALFARFSQPRLQPRLLATQGLVAQAVGDLAAAEAMLREARKGYLDEGAGYDAADISMDLAKVLVLRGDTDALQALAREMHDLFPWVHSEVRRALALFMEAAFQDRVTLEFLEALSTYLQRARYNPALKFELAA